MYTITFKTPQYETANDTATVLTFIIASDLYSNYYLVKTGTFYKSGQSQYLTEVITIALGCNHGFTVPQYML